MIYAHALFLPSIPSFLNSSFLSPLTFSSSVLLSTPSSSSSSPAAAALDKGPVHADLLVVETFAVHLLREWANEWMNA